MNAHPEALRGELCNCPQATAEEESSECPQVPGTRSASFLPTLRHPFHILTAPQCRSFLTHVLNREASPAASRPPIPTRANAPCKSLSSWAGNLHKAGLWLPPAPRTVLSVQSVLCQRTARSVYRPHLCRGTRKAGPGRLGGAGGGKVSSGPGRGQMLSWGAWAPELIQVQSRAGLAKSPAGGLAQAPSLQGGRGGILWPEPFILFPVTGCCHLRAWEASSRLFWAWDLLPWPG